MPFLLTAMAVNCNYPTFKLVDGSLEDFLDFWSKQYRYDNGLLYTENIGKPLTAKTVFQLFEWKNGGPLSDKKKASIQQNYLNDSDKPPVDGSEEELRIYLHKPGGAIWRIFWLHCNAPSMYPIYDQHVHRAMAKLEGWKELEIPIYNPGKVKSYLQHYLPFWKKFERFDHLAVDRALWAYGKFLSYAYRLETSS